MTMLTKFATVLLLTQAIAFAPPGGHSGLNREAHSDDVSFTRRSWFAYTAATLVSSVAFFPIPALATDKFETYQNEVLGFKISVPTSWEKSVQQLPDRRSLTLFIDPVSGEDKTLMFIAKTPIQPDFTSLGSFGSVDQVCRSGLLGLSLNAMHKSHSFLLILQRWHKRRFSPKVSSKARLQSLLC